MNCWKSCNISQDYGSNRIVILSLLSTLSYFVMFYVSFTTMYSNTLVTFNIAISVGCLLAVWPMHKILHCLPFWITGKQATLTFNKINGIPFLNCVVSDAIPKWLSLVSVSFPLIIVTAITLIFAVVFPDYIQYYSIFGSLNFGMSVTDVLYIMILLRAPSKSFVEDDLNTIKILIKNH